MKVRRIDTLENKEIEVLDSESAKLEYIYRLRNEYTHGAQIAGHPAGGVIEDWNKPIIINGKEMLGYVTIRSIPKNAERIDICVRNWPNVLVDAVEIALDALSNKGAAIY